jgi:AraC family transcriptional regulator
MPLAAKYEIDLNITRPSTRGRIHQHLSLRDADKQIEAYYHRVDRPNFGILEANPISEKYHIAVALNAFETINTVVDGKSVGRHYNQPGTTHIYDQRQALSPELLEPHESFNIEIPFWKFEELRYDYNNPRLDECWSYFVLDHDPTMHGLAKALVPAIQKPSEASALFIDHMFSAITLHVACACDFKKYPFLKSAGGLAPWQEGRAKEMLRNGLSGDILLGDLAAACGLSKTYFARAFKCTTGVAPHRWLTEQRIEEAQKLLLDSNHALSEIALLSGFADQAHFTRVFTKAVGVSPGIWRRVHRY